MVGVVEIAAGILVAVRPLIGGYVVAAWLAGIIVNLLLDPRLLRRRVAGLRFAAGRSRAGPAGRRVPPERTGRGAAGGGLVTAVLPHTRTGPPEPVSGHHRPLRVVHPSAPVDLAAAERAAAAFLVALGVDVATENRRGTPGRMARAYAEMFAPRPVRPDHVPQRRGVRRTGARPVHPGAVGVRAPPAAVRRRRPRRVPARRADPRPVEAGPGGGVVRPPPPGAGAADPAGRRLAAEHPGPAWGGGGHRGRAPVHDHARCPQPAGPAPSPRPCRGTCGEDAAARAEFFALALPRRTDRRRR